MICSDVSGEKIQELGDTLSVNCQHKSGVKRQDGGCMGIEIL
jgi:hypothetical protein